MSRPIIVNFPNRDPAQTRPVTRDPPVTQDHSGEYERQAETNTCYATMNNSLQDRIESLSREYQKLQRDLSAAVESRQRLEAQLSENELVEKVCSEPEMMPCSQSDQSAVVQEFKSLSSDNVVYKLVGPVLVEQDQAEAKSNVKTRLDFIRAEMSVLI